eukprot:TRINITY_DN4369_c0_g1_i8.p2 TRINITY_DN4369_c0_g1~~TRINITY_DN4369_c0_g1_i8.p2  ORF type:complete len:190 (-),score=28.90 TRINITY_DN4369_c0_g1_i8:42-611(-)
MTIQRGVLFHLFNFVIIIVLFLEGLASTQFHTRVYRSFSFLGYFLSFLVQVSGFIYNVKGTDERPRAYWLLRQFSWTSNIIITIVFWGVFYTIEEFQAIMRQSLYVHLVMIFMHLFPIVAEVKEMCCTRIEYKKGDFVWTVVYLLCYGVVNIVDTLMEKKALYPLLTWKDATSITVSYTHLTLPTNREV